MTYEGAWLDRIAASLAEEDGDGVVRSILLQSRVAALGVRRIATPLVRIQAEEIQSLGAVTSTSQVVLEIWTKISNVGSRVADWNLAVALGVAVGLHVPSSGLDVRGGGAIGADVEHLVADEEAAEVVV